MSHELVNVLIPRKSFLDFECLYLLYLSQRFPDRLRITASSDASSLSIRLADGRPLTREGLEDFLGLPAFTAHEAAAAAVISERLLPSVYFLIFRDDTIYSNFTCAAVSSTIARFRLKRKLADVAGRMRSRGRALQAISEALEYVKVRFGAETREDFKTSTHPRIYAELSASLLLLFSIPGDKRIHDIFTTHEPLAKLLDVSVWQTAGGDPSLALQGFRTTFERPTSFWDKLFPKSERKSPDWQRKLFVFGAAMAVVGFIMSGKSLLGSGESGGDEYEMIDANE